LTPSPDTCIKNYTITKGAAIERDIRKIRQRLEKEGWQAKEGGRHTVYTHPEKKGRVVLPRGRGDLPTGTARDIARNAGWE